MTRLPTFDRALLVLLVPLWALCFSLSLFDTIERMGFPPVNVTSPASDRYPFVVDFRDGLGVEASGLHAGDELLRAANQDLRGAGQIKLSAIFADFKGGDAVPVTYVRDQRTAETSLRARSKSVYWPRLPASLVFAATAIVLLLRAAPSQLIRIIFCNYMTWAMLLACTFAGNESWTIFSIVVQGVSFGFAVALGVRGALMFPHGMAPSSSLARFGPWVFLLIGALDVSRFYGTPFPREVGVTGDTVLGLLSVVAVGIAIFYNYRRSTAIQRRQIKWVLFGVYCAAVAPTLIAILSVYDARFEPSLIVSMSSLALVPISLLIAVIRYNLFDIDRLISSAASYTVLGILALATLLAGVPRIAYSLGEPMGLQPEKAQMALSVLLAGVIVPLQRLLRPRVDRVLFAERYAIEIGFQQLLEDLSDCVDLHGLVDLAGTRLDALLHPESLVIYTRSQFAYAPALVRGRAEPIAFDPQGPLMAALKAHGGPILSGRAAQESRELTPFDRAAIEMLGVPLVVPVRGGDGLAAFICLGAKRSGDVYTSNDIAMLAAVADKSSSELRRFDQAEIIRQGRAMQDALRRYVPGPVAEQLARGGKLDVGERELSVLFVDIRNYTAYSEQRPPGEVFAAVNRYTEAVSKIVYEEGGCVVEFSGDGVMAVFGAPRELPGKERAAVAAALRIVETVDALALGGRESLTVGAGIATGNAYVGNVRSADRFIWTAIGNTTNLASRLQDLTRDIGAAIVVDALTWQRAGDLASSFASLDQVAIRGQSNPLNVHFLPLRAAA